jgi:Beta-lactamase
MLNSPAGNSDRLTRAPREGPVTTSRRFQQAAVSGDIGVTELLISWMRRLVAQGHEMAQQVIDQLAHEAKQRIGIGCGQHIVEVKVFLPLRASMSVICGHRRAGVNAMPLLVSQGGKLVFELYGQGDDEAKGRGTLGTVVFGSDVPHGLRSVSKSVVGLACGIALAAGKVPTPEAKLYEQFPEYSDLAGQPGRDRLTVHHALSMTLGLDWDELTIPYRDPRNAESATEAAPDRFRFILERPPGRAG